MVFLITIQVLEHFDDIALDDVITSHKNRYEYYKTQKSLVELPELYYVNPFVFDFFKQTSLTSLFLHPQQSDDFPNHIYSQPVILVSYSKVQYQ